MTSAIAGAAQPLSTIPADLIVVPWLEGEGADAASGLDAACGGDISRALASGEFVARPFEVLSTSITGPDGKTRRLVLIGAGREAGAGGEMARKLAAAAGLLAKQRRVSTAAFVLRGGTGAVAERAQAVAEGLTLAAFDIGSYKTGGERVAAAPAWTIVLVGSDGNAAGEVDAALARGRLLGECSNLARGLANEPSNALTPRVFATRAASIAAEGGVSVEVLDERQLAELGMGLLLGVGQGSSEPPRLLVFRHDPPGAPAAPVLGLVGKGITFDTGGISIKPAEGMERMKTDMSGGAAVTCAMRAIGLLKAPIRVIGIVPLAENMPGGRAIKPGDILKSAEGKTVEVINTDAEGRLVLGDGLWYARRLGATHLVDVATLTGACVVALGKSTTGLFGAPTDWVEQVRQVALRAGDRVWPMPVFDDYREQLKSEIADFTNTGGRPAGAITAALFLKEFSGGLPWVHLDIAGTAWAEETKPYQPKGPTGVAVRTLAELAFSSGAWARGA